MQRFGFALFMDAAEADIATQALQGTVLFGKAIEVGHAYCNLALVGLIRDFTSNNAGTALAF